MFTDIDSTIEIDGFTLSARVAHDEHMGAPWDEHDGHGEVSDWRRKNCAGYYPKAPGELLLYDDGRNARFYDYAAACRTARADGWGPSPYRLDIERGANGLCRANAHWFEGRELLAYVSIWHDDENAARADVYEQLQADIGRRRYAAMAARSDFERMRGWSDDSWHWVGVIVTASREGVELGSASLWGIESDAGAYLVDVANELTDEALDEARDKVAALTA